MSIEKNLQCIWEKSQGFTLKNSMVGQLSAAICYPQNVETKSPCYLFSKTMRQPTLILFSRFSRWWIVEWRCPWHDPVSVQSPCVVRSFRVSVGAQAGQDQNHQGKPKHCIQQDTMWPREIFTQSDRYPARINLTGPSPSKSPYEIRNYVRLFSQTFGELRRYQKS